MGSFPEMAAATSAKPFTSRRPGANSLVIHASLNRSRTILSMQRQVILASTSRYRRELMLRLRLTFDVHAPEVDETPMADETPRALAERLALEKATAVARRFPEAIVIGSDQVADLSGEPLGKPGDHARATVQLRRMRGQTLIFQTAVAVVCQKTGFSQCDLAAV